MGFMLFWFVLFVVALVVIYYLWVRPWQLRWGASDEEYTKSMPGDDIVQHPHFAATRAVNVEAPPEAIWPWIRQMGYGRAGWYSYDFIDHLGKPSSWSILPEFQNLKVGDDIPFTPWNWLGMRVLAIEENHMIWQDRQDGGTWLWFLEATDENHTRLITHRRVRYKWFSAWVVYLLVQDVADIIMMRKCMLGIKARAEKLVE